MGSVQAGISKGQDQNGVEVGLAWDVDHAEVPRAKLNPGDICYSGGEELTRHERNSRSERHRRCIRRVDKPKPSCPLRRLECDRDQRPIAHARPLLRSTGNWTREKTGEQSERTKGRIVVHLTLRRETAHSFGRQTDPVRRGFKSESGMSLPTRAAYACICGSDSRRAMPSI